MPIENELVAMGQSQDWYSGQMENSYSSNCLLGVWLQWAVFLNRNLFFCPTLINYWSHLAHFHNDVCDRWIWGNCFPLHLCGGQFRKLPLCLIKCLGSIPDSVSCLPSNYHGFEINDEENCENQRKIARAPLERTYSLLRYWYKSMKYLGWF